MHPAERITATAISPASTQIFFIRQEEVESSAIKVAVLTHFGKVSLGRQITGLADSCSVEAKALYAYKFS